MVYNVESLDRVNQARGTVALVESLPTIEREYIDPSPATTPLLEFADPKLEGVYFVRYSDLERLAESNEISIQEAARGVRDANLLPDSRFVVAMEEWRPILNPDIVDAFSNVILIKEQGPGSVAYQACEACMTMFLETQDMLYVDLFLEADDASMTQYYLKAERLQSQISAATEEIKKMRQNDPAYPNAQKRLMGMQDALDKTNKMIAELRSRGSQVNLLKHEPGTADNARKAGEQRGKEFAEKAAKGFQKPQQQPQSQDQSQQSGSGQGWWAQKWSAFKNWMNNLGNNGDQKSTWFTNMLNNVKAKFGGSAQAAKDANQTQSSTTPNQQQPSPQTSSNPTDQLVDKGAQQVSNLANKGVDAAVDKATQLAKDKLGIDLGDTAKALGGMAKQAVDSKVQQVKEKGKAVVKGVTEGGGDAIVLR